MLPNAVRSVPANAPRMNRDWLLGSLGTLLFLDVELERQFGYVKVRYRGLAKNTAQLHMLFRMDR